MEKCDKILLLISRLIYTKGQLYRIIEFISILNRPTGRRYNSLGFPPKPSLHAIITTLSIIFYNNTILQLAIIIIFHTHRK